MTDLDRIARDMLASWGTPTVMPRATEQYPGFTLADGYAVAHRIRDLRLARGERVVGRKVGGTNVKIAASIGASKPSWSFMYDTTVSDLPAEGAGTFAIGGFRQTRIEPELAVRLCAEPTPGMDHEALIGCIDAVAHVWEFVHSPYSDWKVAPPDAAIAFGLHQALLTGPWHDITDDRAGWIDRLATFTVVLRGSTDEVHEGGGINVLGSPLNVLRALAEDVASSPGKARLQPGEIVSTGTLTELPWVRPGETWSTEVAGAPLPGLRVTLT